MLHQLAARRKISLEKMNLVQRRLQTISSLPNDAEVHTADYIRTRNPIKSKVIIGLCALALIVVAVVVNYEYNVDKKFPAAKGMCDFMREKSLDECAIAFEDSYYAGGFSGRDMDWRRIRDSARCQNLGNNIYFACINNSKTD